MGYPRTAPAVIEYLNKLQPGDQFTREGLAEATGFNGDQVAAVINTRIRDGRLLAGVLERGYMWVFHGWAGSPTKEPDTPIGVATEAVPAGGTGEIRLVPPAAPKGMQGNDGVPEGPPALYESVRLLPGGRVLLVDELGNLWVARHLEVQL